MLKVGDIFIANYDTGYDYEKAPENDEPNPNCWAVVISHLDPGFASYGPGSTTVMRLMFLTCARTILLLESCLELLYTRDGCALGHVNSRRPWLISCEGKSELQTSCKG